MGCTNKNVRNIETDNPEKLQGNDIKTDNQNDLPEINIEKALDEMSNEKVQMSEFISSIKYVPLETNKSCQIGKRPKILVTNQHIFCDDFMFDLDGSFIKRLGKRGRGPGEYTLPRSIAVDENRNEFFVYAGFLSKILIYDLNNNFKRSVDVSYYGKDLFPLGDGLIFTGCEGAFNPDYFDYSIINSDNGDTIKIKRSSNVKYVSSESPNRGLNSKTCCWYYNNELRYYEFLSDTIFRITPSKEIPLYKLNLGDYKIPLDKISMVRSSGAYSQVWEIAETQKYLIFLIILKGFNRYYLCFNKTTNEVHASEFDKAFNNDIDGGPVEGLRNSQNRNILYTTLYPFNIQQDLEFWKTSNSGFDHLANQSLLKIINNTNPNDNPIICLFQSN